MTEQYPLSFSLRTIIGLSLLGISTIAWLALPVIPFLPYETSILASLGAGVFVFAEVTWWLSIPVLGKPFFMQIKAWLKAVIAELREPKTNNHKDGDKGDE